MIVTFVSECQKNSLKLTRQVLDTYAHRIGQRTWQSIMTEQGLQAVRSRLSRTARKTTAVACHRARGTRRTELLWIVGNRNRFDNQGNVPVNRTRRDLLKEHDQNDWRFLSTMQSIVAISSLFHDFGKAWDPFQKILRLKSKPTDANRDPVRHEWISMLLFFAFVQGKQDSQWLAELEQINERSDTELGIISDRLVEDAMSIAQSQPDAFLVESTVLAKWIGWLIISHHRLPHLDAKQFGESSLIDEDELLKRIRVTHGYLKQNEISIDLEKHWRFKDGLPLRSGAWRSKASRWGRKLGDELSLFGDSRINNLQNCGRVLLTLSRMMLMLADHEVSSKPEHPNWASTWPPFANTYSSDRNGRLNGDLRQRLDEHLVRVTDSAVALTHLLPALEDQMQTAQSIRPLRKPSSAAFAWQNRAVDELRRWQVENRLEKAGFFAVNMASTGKGKTFANAKIMDAINPNGLRYCLALGLRTLTLQTGDEYREKLKLDQNELAVLIGSAAVRVLHEQRKKNTIGSGYTLTSTDAEQSGSESEHSLTRDFEFMYEDLIPDDAITTVLTDRKSRQLLKSPILVCTIDHLMPAVESGRGGYQILPMLRLLSSDLVIDEVDDFDHNDMPAISRLIHLAGMLGRKVMISSATIPPAVAEGLHHAYREGWKQFAAFRDRPNVVTAFWVDEYAAKVERVADDVYFAQGHERFTQARVRALQRETKVACRAEMCPMAERTTIDRRSSKPSLSTRTVAQAPSHEESQSLRELWHCEVTLAAIHLHREHSETDTITGKQVSIGVIRVANVDPCIDLAIHLLQCELPEDIELRVMPYHARQVLLLRSEQERFLDGLLNRKSKQDPWSDPVMRSHLKSSNRPNVMFVLVASPVVEVGRDFDFDWAVIEPSSMRSIIQMAGRVRRHRGPSSNKTPNIVLPELNLVAFSTSREVVFNQPGFEGGRYRLESKCLSDIMNFALVSERLDSQSRILDAKVLAPTKSLVDLEHQVLRDILTSDDLRPGFVRGWTQCGYYLTDLAQQCSRFRQSSMDTTYKLHLTEEGEPVFRQVDPNTRISDGPQGKSVTHLHVEPISDSYRQRLWLALDYATLIEHQKTILDRSQRSTCEFLGEIRLQDQDGSQHFRWSAEMGARRQ